MATRFKLEALLNGELVGEIIIEGADSGEIIVQLLKEQVEASLPERSPLHPEAINVDDLKPGLKIQRCHGTVGSDRGVGIVIGEPFKRADKYGDGGSNADQMMITVATHDFRDQLVTRDWFLADMGVVPYVGDRGAFWNRDNYTLAVS